MKQGYIVWNQTNYSWGYEFFGVYRTWESALRQYRKVIRTRYGKCPRGDYDAILKFLSEQGDTGDGYMISEFEENVGEKDE